MKNFLRNVGWMVASAGFSVACSACRDWPHLDYAESPLRMVVEVEAEDAEGVQNLQQLHGDVLVEGVIDSGVYVPATERDAPFDLPGWYAGDMDWFQFNVRDPADVRLELGWAEGPNVLDLYFFEAESDTGQLFLITYDASEGAVSREILGTALSPGVVYVLAVAGHVGDGVPYDLLLDLEK